jgi:hypothetical protein
MREFSESSPACSNHNNPIKPNAINVQISYQAWRHFPSRWKKLVLFLELTALTSAVSLGAFQQAWGASPPVQQKYFITDNPRLIPKIFAVF